MAKMSGMKARQYMRAMAVLAAALVVWVQAAAADPIRVLVLGDSLTAGYGLPAEAAFPVRLEAALRAEGIDAVVINAGVSGDTTAGGRARLDWALADGPDAAIVELGANDAMRGIKPAAVYNNLNAILTRLKEAGIEVLLTGMHAPPNLGREYGDAFDAVYTRLVDEHEVDFYPFFLEGVAARPRLNQRDFIHPNAKGVDVIVESILPDVIDLIERSEAAD
jgi:acyl-CoA thioesterase-1